MPHAQRECLVAIYPKHTHRQAEQGERNGAEAWTATDPSERPWPWGCVLVWKDTCSGYLLHCNLRQGGGHLPGRVMSTEQEMCRARSLGWPWRSALWEETGRVEFVSPAITEDKGDMSAFTKYFGASKGFMTKCQAVGPVLCPAWTNEGHSRQRQAAPLKKNPRPSGYLSCRYFPKEF